MTVENCEEKKSALKSPEEVTREIKALLPKLEKIFRGQKPGRGGAQAWVDATSKTIVKAFCLLELRGYYSGPEQDPQLEELFATLNASATRADAELFRYGVNMKIEYKYN